MEDVALRSWYPSLEPTCGLRIFASAEVLAAFTNLPELDRRGKHFLALKLKGACPGEDGPKASLLLPGLAPGNADKLERSTSSPTHTSLLPWQLTGSGSCPPPNRN